MHWQEVRYRLEPIKVSHFLICNIRVWMQEVNDVMWINPVIPGLVTGY